MTRLEPNTHNRNPAHWPPTIADLLFLLAGAIAGGTAAVYAYDRSASLPLALFAFAMVMYVVGAGPLHLLGMPHTFQRVVFVLLLPVCSVPVYWAVDARWDN